MNEDFLDFVAGLLKVAREEISLDSAYGELPQWDSVMHIRLVMEIEAKYGRVIPLEVVPQLRKLRDFLPYVQG